MEIALLLPSQWARPPTLLRIGNRNHSAHFAGRWPTSISPWSRLGFCLLTKRFRAFMALVSGVSQGGFALPRSSGSRWPFIDALSSKFNREKKCELIQNKSRFARQISCSEGENWFYWPAMLRTNAAFPVCFGLFFAALADFPFGLKLPPYRWRLGKTRKSPNGFAASGQGLPTCNWDSALLDHYRIL